MAYAADHEGIDLLELRFSPGYMAGGIEQGIDDFNGGNCPRQQGHCEYPSSWDDYMQAVLDGCAMGSKGRKYGTSADGGLGSE